MKFYFKDLDTSSDEEDNFSANRKQFQQSRSTSTASKKSISFFDMELTNRDDNIRNSVPFVRQITEDGKAKLEIYRPTTNPIYIYTQVSQNQQNSQNISHNNRRIGLFSSRRRSLSHHTATCSIQEQTS